MDWTGLLRRPLKKTGTAIQGQPFNAPVLTRRRRQRLLLLCLVLSLNLQTAVAAVPEVPLPPPQETLWLVNEAHPLSPVYVPAPLVGLDGKVRVSRTGHVLREDAGEALIRMFSALQSEGHHDALVRSAYRAYEYQERYFNEQLRLARASGASDKEAMERVRRRVALPGASEHQLGLAVDLGSTQDGLITRFHLTSSGRWLADHAWAYGFILRYPRDKTQWTGFGYEPWHFRYTGWPHSEVIAGQGWILEEYLAILARSHYLESALSDGRFVRIAMRAESESLPEGLSEVQTDHQGHRIGFILFEEAQRTNLDRDDRWWLRRTSKNTLGPSAEDQLQALLSPRTPLLPWTFLDKFLPVLLEGQASDPVTPAVIWQGGSVTAALMPSPSLEVFNGHPVALPVSVIRVSGSLKGPLGFIDLDKEIKAPSVP